MTIFKTDEKTVPMVELFGLEKDELNEFMNSAFIYSSLLASAIPSALRCNNKKDQR